MCALGTFAVTVSIGLTMFIVSFIFIFQDLVFAVLISNNQLVTLVRLKQFVLHPQDLHILLNMVQASDAFKDAESWLPVCLPKFDSRYYMSVFFITVIMIVHFVQRLFIIHFNSLGDKYFRLFDVIANFT